MEADGALKLVLDIHREFENKVNIKSLVSDDDSSTRKILTKVSDSNTKGSLPTDMNDITFLCDVNHRIKCMSKP